MFCRNNTRYYGLLLARTTVERVRCFPGRRTNARAPVSGYPRDAEKGEETGVIPSRRRFPRRVFLRTSCPRYVTIGPPPPPPSVQARQNRRTHVEVHTYV